MIARNQQINQIEGFITSRMDLKSSGILYLTGPPGTGKTMCIQHVLDKLKTTSNKYKDVVKVDINCMRIQKARSVLVKICTEIGIEKQLTSKSTEADMICKLTKRISSRNSAPCLFIMDEIDQLPKSKNFDLIKTIFSWPTLPFSKLILVAISNTFNLTSRQQTLSTLLGHDASVIEKITFKPYSSNEIKSILTWYLENDENYQDADLDPKALDIICKISAKKGDIRAALNACKSTLDDAIKEEREIHNTTLKITTNITSTPLNLNAFGRVQKRPMIDTSYIMPKKLDVCNLADSSILYTPPPSPKPKARATLPLTATSIKKRQKSANNIDDVFPFNHQLVLFSVSNLITSTKKPVIDTNKCYSLFIKLGQRFQISESRDCFLSILESLETQGLIRLTRPRVKNTIYKVSIHVSESEIDAKIVRKELILEALKCIKV